MTPEEVGRGLVEAVPGAAYAVAHDQVTVSVPAEHWHAAAAAARDRLDATFFDWLSAVDEPPDAIAVTCHLWSVAGRHGVLLQATLPRERPRLATVTDLFAGAAWHERETHEMFGVDFAGNPDLRPLLLPDGFAGHPLRKDFVLAARVAKPFPGAKEPGESGTPSRVRRRLLPPGVPAPGEWGPA